MQNQLKINIPNTAIERINQIVEEHSIFENSEDFIIHAITDKLEKYRLMKKEWTDK